MDGIGTMAASGASAVTPDREELRRLAASGAGNVAAVCREVRADLETPVSAYLKAARGPYSFLLESVEGGERMGRYSYIGADPYRVRALGRGDGDPLEAIAGELARFRPVPAEGLPRFRGGAVGYIGYEAAGHFERTPRPETDALGVPESWLMFADTLLVFDHVLHTIRIVAHARLDGDVDAAWEEAAARIDGLAERLAAPLAAQPYVPIDGPSGRPVESNWTPAGYRQAVERTKRYIAEGDIIQAVIAQRFLRETGVHPVELYRSLRVVNPSPYMYLLRFGGTALIGASPELLVKVEDGRVEMHPIAGTRPRGSTPAEDERLAAELRRDPKELAEHVMLLDLGRNDVGRVARTGTVEVTQRFEIERYSHVMHLVSHVEGELREGLDAADALRAAFPAGTVSGAPKIRAMEIIAGLEPDRRGPYAGAVGFFDFSGNAETCITIRTVLLRDGVAAVQAGAGIVHDSDPQREFEESQHKARALLAAIDDAEERALRAAAGGSAGVR